ncbi:hypothetical protein BH09PSE2_BH09PSE2_24240 [soil metagenome]
MAFLHTDPFYAALIEAVADECDAPATSISPHGTVADVPGWDSLRHIRIMMNLETRLGRKVDVRATYAAEDFEALRNLFLVAGGPP